MKDMSTLTSREMSELAALYRSWKHAREARDYYRADTIRSQLIEWGCFGPDYTTWHGVLESPDHRMKRLACRVTYEIGD